jgi:ABC-type hemin transport system ATPase subunit
VATGAPADVLTAETLARHYGATAEVAGGPDGVRVYPVRPSS